MEEQQFQAQPIALGEIYLIWCDVSPIQYAGYVGYESTKGLRTLKDRWQEHYRSGGLPIDKLIREIGKEHWFCRHLAYYYSVHERDEMECSAAIAIGWPDKQLCYNYVLPNGGGHSQRHHPDTILKLREPKTPEHVDKVSKALQGRFGKLTEAKVLEALSLQGIVPQSEIARRLGVTRSCVCSIIQGNNWKHLPREVKAVSTLRHRGEANTSSRFTEAEILEMRALEGTMTQTEIAKRFNTYQTVVSNILSRNSWNHIPPAVSPEVCPTPYKRRPKGPPSTLKDEDALAILALEGTMTQTEIAKRFNTGQSVVSQIFRKVRFPHLQTPPFDFQTHS